MIAQNTISSDIAYCRKLIETVKSSQRVAASNALVYKASQTVEAINVAAYPDTRVIRVKVSHPGIINPLAQPRLNWSVSDSTDGYYTYKIFITDDTSSVNIGDETSWFVTIENNYTLSGFKVDIFFDVQSLVPDLELSHEVIS